MTGFMKAFLESVECDVEASLPEESSDYEIRLAAAEEIMEKGLQITYSVIF